MTAPTLDGHANATHSGTGSGTVTLTTSNTNDIIVVAIYNETNAGAPAVSSVTSPGLTFAQRSKSNGSTNGSLEIWWALATGTLTAAVITVAWASTIDDGNIVAYGVSGCATAHPWDANVSLPAKASFTAANSQPTVTGISTSQANDFILEATGALTSGGNTPPSGWTTIDHNSNTGGTNQSFLEGGFLAVTSTQSSITATATYIVNGFGSQPSAGSEMIVDALTADPGGFGSSTTSARAFTTMNETLGKDTASKAMAAATLKEALGADSATEAMAAATMKEGVGANPITKAMVSLTLKEVLILNTTVVPVTITVVNNTGMPVGIGNRGVIFDTRLEATSSQVSASAIEYTIVTPPAHGFFTVNGVQQSSFTQADINAGLVIYNASDMAYRYAYRAANTTQYTGEIPNRQAGTDAVQYIEPGSTTRADSFVFTFMADTVIPAGNSTFNFQLIDEGFAFGSEPVGEDGMLEMPVNPEVVEMPVASETLEM